MTKKLLTLLIEEIKEQGFGRYYTDVLSTSGKRLGDVKSVNLNTKKQVEVLIPPSEEEEEEEEFDVLNNITDISSSSTYKRKNETINAKYFILHHTAGTGTAQDVVNTLNTRKDGPLGIQWVIDRQGKIFQTLPLGSRGAHIRDIRSDVPKDMSNSTAAGVEIVAEDDSDVLQVQCKSALKLVKKLGYSDSQIYGHGDVSTNREPSEGQKCKSYIRSNRDNNVKDNSNSENNNERIIDNSRPDIDDKLSGTIVMGDSITPHLSKAAGFNAGPQAKGSSDKSGIGLWFGGIGLVGFQNLVKNYKSKHLNVEKVVITIGTNGYGGTSGVSLLAKNLKKIFPKASLFVCQGAYGDGWKKIKPYHKTLGDVTQTQVDKFYDAFKNAGIIVVPYPIKDTVTDVHNSSVPVYKKWKNFINAYE